MNRKHRFALIVILQSLLLVAMVGLRQITLETGTRVLLETQPIDPRSLFRGDYIRLNYSIATLQLNELEGDDEFKRHDPVYVVLNKGERYWGAAAVFRQHPGQLDDAVVLRGEVKYFNSQHWNRETSESEERPNITVRYGVENYFVPEGEGLRLERPQEGEVVSIEVAVDSKGVAAISGLWLNDQRLYEEGIL